MKLLTVFLVFCILAFDLATSQDNNPGEKLDEQNEDQFNKSMDKFEAFQNLPITFEEYQSCIMNGNHFDLNTGYCYKYVVLTDKKRNWNDAKTACVAQGMVLATVNSKQEWQVVKGIIPSGVDMVWLGGSDSESEGTWVWTDGSPVSYSDWSASEPNDGTSRNCLVAWRNYNWQWFDGTCTNDYMVNALCKIPDNKQINNLWAIEKLGEKLEKQHEAIVSDIREQTNLILNVYNTLNGKLTNVQSQNEDQFENSMDKFEAIQKLSEISIGITLEEYEKEYEECSKNGNYYDLYAGYCYKYMPLTDKKRTWNDAKTECKAKQGILASIKSREEWQFVKGVLDNTSSGVGQVWLGGSDAEIEGHWVWSDGSPVTYTDWYGSEPYYSSTSNNCLVAKRSENWQWVDYPFQQSWYAVCKIQA